MEIERGDIKKIKAVYFIKGDLNPDIVCPLVEKLTDGKAFFVDKEVFFSLPFHMEFLKGTAIPFMMGDIFYSESKIK